MKKTRRRGGDVSVPVASMGDIAFLLIIFFMVCSNFVKENSVQLEPPRAKDIENIKESPVSVAIDAESRIYLQGAEVSAAADLEGGVAALIKDKVTAEGRTVIFKCDQGVKSRRHHFCGR